MIRVGIVGLGVMGRTHYEVYAKQKDVRVVEVADLDPKRCGGDLSGTQGNILQGGVARLEGAIKGTTDFRELLAEEAIDLVDICVPTPAHAEIAIAALQAGKHVVCEKPLARTLAQARRIAKVAKSAKGYFMPAMCMRFWPQWVWLKDAVKSRRYGKVQAAHFRRVGAQPGGWYKDAAKAGGAILDLHIHDVDFIYHLFGKPREVRAVGFSKQAGRGAAIDHVFTNYSFPGIPVVNAEGGWGVADGFGFTMRYTVIFERATADFDSAKEEPLRLIQNGNAEAVKCAAGNGYEYELRYMLDCIKQHRRPKVVTADDGVMSVRIVEAEVKSVLTGKPVKI